MISRKNEKRAVRTKIQDIKAIAEEQHLLQWLLKL